MEKLASPTAKAVDPLVGASITILTVLPNHPV